MNIHDRPQAAKHVRRETDQSGDVLADVFQVGKYEVRIPSTDDLVQDGPPVTFKAPYDRSTKVDRILPSIEIDDGVLRIDLEDLAQVILDRASPAEIAEACWANEDVREAFMEAFTQTYYTKFTDADRRKWIASVQGVIHSLELSRLTNAISDVEHNAAKLANEAARFSDFNLFLKGNNAVHGPTPYNDQTGRTGKPIEYPFARRNIIDLSIRTNGGAWSDARDFWRNQVLAWFPPPPDLSLSYQDRLDIWARENAAPIEPPLAVFDPSLDIPPEIDRLEPGQTWTNAVGQVFVKITGGFAFQPKPGDRWIAEDYREWRMLDDGTIQCFTVDVDPEPGDHDDEIPF